LTFLSSDLALYSQIIKGIILDKETRNPVTYAIVYFDGTSVATQTDDKGFFKMDVRNYASMPLTISALGYYSSAIVNFSPDKDIVVYLTPKVFEMKEVTVNARGNADLRRQNMAIFRTEFLGRTSNAKECEIVNEDDIRFITSPDKDTIKAVSSKPLIIINNGLGYKITYYLNKFEYIKSTYTNQLIGNSLFEEDTISALNKQKFETRRNEAYIGSKMHFFRSLWYDDLKSAGYIVKNLKQQLSYKDIVRQQLSINLDNTRKYLYYSGPLPALLSVKLLPGKAESGMELLRNNIFFEKNGYYKGPGIIWHGEMAKQGIADLLPFDFQPSGKVKEASENDFSVVDTITPDGVDIRITHIPEKVYLHTDRDIYNPGDDIWFKSYLVDGLNHILFDSSKSLHVELISPGLKIIDSKIIRLENGLGSGDIGLPDSIKTGNYRLRAYTNHMRNFGDQLFFNKEILIISGSDTSDMATTVNKFTDNNLKISFFPEGGSLVDNVPSTVAFKAVNAEGQGCNVSGEIYSSSGELVTTFRSVHLGMGTFILNPLPGVTYYSIVKNSEGDVIRVDIPKSFARGLVLSALVNEKNQYLLTIETNRETLPAYFNRNLLITVSVHKKILKTIVFKMEKILNTLVLPVNDLRDGIVMITLFGLDSRPICERLINIQNSNEIKVLVASDKKVYNRRDSVSVLLTVLEDFGISQDAFLSFSATEKIFERNTSQYPTSISSWFLLESDVHGKVEDPSYYFDSSNADRLKNLNLLLLTQGWRDFEWKYKGAEYLYETGFTISGRLRKSIFNTTLKNSSVMIGLLQGEKSIVISSPVDSVGNFRLDLDNLTGKANVIISAVDKNGNFQGRLTLDSYRYTPAKISEDETNMVLVGIQKTTPDDDINILKQADQSRKSIKKKYTLSDTILIDEVFVVGKKKKTPGEVHVNESRAIYGEPDDEVIITPELASLRTIKDLLIGKVAGVYSIGQGSGIRIRGYGSSFEMGGEPLFLLDGVVVEYGVVYAIPLHWIDRVDVIKSERAAAFGVRGSNGIISVITKTSGNISYLPVSYSINTIISGYDAPRIFYSPEHNSKFREGTVPDLRPTLYWFPDIKVVTNKDYKLKYFNADISATYQIIVEGITSEGIPVTGKAEYEVK
jgi:hypothetical protein